jgi:hypothetical protein
VPSHRRNNIFPAATIVLIGIGLAVFGYLRSSQPFASTSGVITESAALGGMKSSIWRTIRYTYRVAGRDYAGQATVRNSLAHDAVYQVGRDLRVFFVSSAPARSYAFDPPMALPWIAGGSVLALLGCITLFFAWNA